jgi:hypothetical protein
MEPGDSFKSFVLGVILLLVGASILGVVLQAVGRLFGGH